MLKGPSQHLPLGSGPTASSTLARLLRGRLTEGAGSGNAGQSPRSRRAKPSRSGGRPGVLGLPRVPGVPPSSHSWPEAHLLRAPMALHRPQLLHQVPNSKERRASRAVLPSRFPRATATKWRTREKQPATSPSAQRVLYAHARAPAPRGRRGPPPTSCGTANQERGRDGSGLRRSLPLPRSGRRRRCRRQRALPSWPLVRRWGRCGSRVSSRWQENSWSPEGAAFRKPALGTKRNVQAESLAREAWYRGDLASRGDGPGWTEVA